jgi:MAF protein
MRSETVEKWVPGDSVEPSIPFECGNEIVLASASPRRRELISALGISFRVAAADVDEKPLPNEKPEELVRRLAATKALTVARRESAAQSKRAVGMERQPGPLVLAADTEVAWAGSVLGKPANAAAARAMLVELRGGPHAVLTGLALAVGDAVVWSSVVETAVWMRAYADSEIERYVASGLPLDKAGAYGIQDGGFQPVARIDGCYTNVVGLPLCDVIRGLRLVAPDCNWGTPDAEGLCARFRAAAGVPGAAPCEIASRT